MLMTSLHNTTESEELIRDAYQMKLKIEEIEKIYKKLDIPHYLAIGNLQRMYVNKDVITYRRQVYKPDSQWSTEYVICTISEPSKKRTILENYE